MKSINGKLLVKPSNVNQTPPPPPPPDPDFTGYHAYLSYEIEFNPSGGTTLLTSQREHDVCNKDGDFRFSLPDQVIFHDDIAYIEILAPNGQQLAKKAFTSHALKIANKDKTQKDNTNPVEIEVDLLEIVTSPLGPKPEMISGKLINITGNCFPPCIKLVFWSGSLEQPPDNEDGTTPPPIIPPFDKAKYKPFHSVDVEKNGQFEFPKTNQTFEAVFVTISGDLSHPVQVDLDSKGQLPSLILLPIEFESDDPCCGDCNCENGDSEDCGCSDCDNGSQTTDIGGSCNVKLKPNRTVEEFIYCSFVRTTEPEISRYTIGEIELYDIAQELSGIATQAQNYFSNFFGGVKGIKYHSKIRDAAESQAKTQNAKLEL